MTKLTIEECETTTGGSLTGALFGGIADCISAVFGGIISMVTGIVNVFETNKLVEEELSKGHAKATYTFGDTTIVIDDTQLIKSGLVTGTHQGYTINSYDEVILDTLDSF